MAVTPSNTLTTDALALVSTGTPYLALYTNNPTAADTGTEVTGGSYSRKAITFGSPSGGVISNTAAVTFLAMPGVTVTHWGIKSAATGGTLRCSGDFTSPIIFSAGDDLTIAVGDIDISFSGV